MHSPDKFEGHVDCIKGARVLGWAWRSDMRDAPISVDLYIDDTYVCSAAASAYRPDLEAAGKGNGKHAFQLKLPDECYDGKPHSLRLCYHGTETDLYGSPRTVHFEPKPESVRVGETANGPFEVNERSEKPSKTPPKVSVIIPCYNLGAYLDQTVQSVLNQTFQDFEIIIIDDGSTDPATCHLFASYQRPKTRIFRTPNQGLASARNLGIAEARGVYISCLDADDLLEPAFLQQTVQVLDNNPSFAFASCWLKGFGESAFDWNPTTCEFPRLLAEDTVCTPALMRRDAVQQVGGFDAQMPVPGYEDWDLAISLVERGLAGTIIPEYLFKYRIRAGSMSASCTSPENHALLVRYIVEKHAETYRKYLPGILEEIEKRFRDLIDDSGASADQSPRIKLLEDNLALLLRSRSWRSMRPVRQGVSRARLLASRLFRRDEQPKFSVVLHCRDQGRDLPYSLYSVKRQLEPGDEILVVDGGSTDLLTLQMLDWYRESGMNVIKTPGAGPVKARYQGLQSARGEFVFALETGWTIEEGYFRKARAILDSRSDISFVSCGVYHQRLGIAWIPDSLSLSDLAGHGRIPFPIIRRKQLVQAGGYDTAFDRTEDADWDLLLRLGELGYQGELIKEALLLDHTMSVGEQVRTVSTVVEKHKSTFDLYWKEAILGWENQRRRLQAKVQEEVAAAEDSTTERSIAWGELRRLDPISKVWGLDRGQPVDRYYIGRFLDRCRGDIRGRVLEVKDSGYTQTYGNGVTSIDVVDITPDNPSATLVCDLSSKGSLPRNMYDCFIVTQTIHIIYEIRKVIENAYRTLRPGGVLLATLPCVSRIDYESGLEHDQWRFTPASARQLFEEIFGVGHVAVECHGNILVCCSFLMGLAAEELTADELNHTDPYFPLLITVRAVKEQTKALVTNRIRESKKALVLMYHRVGSASRDRWNLCISPENFAAQMRSLRQSFNPVRLAEIEGMVQEGKIREGSVAVTFDDGYRDSLVTAIPIMRTSRVPGTFFICGDAASEAESFWWELLAASFDSMNLDASAADELHRSLMVADVVERKRILAELPAPPAKLPKRLSHEELRLLANDPLADIGAHGWSHRVLAPLSVEQQRNEILRNIQSLAELTGVRVSHFAYPFGGPVTATTKSILGEAGISAACAIGNTAVTEECDPLIIPRLEVGNWGVAEFEDRLRSALAG